MCVEPIARASIACVYEAEIEAESAESAFASAYLALSLSDCDTVTAKTVEKRNGVFFLRIEYTAIEKINL